MILQPVEVPKRYGRLTQLTEFFGWKQHADSKLRNYAFFECDCGSVIWANKSHVISGHTTSCGCYRTELTVELGNRSAEWSTTHGGCGHPAFVNYKSMMRRCGYWEGAHDGYLTVLVCDRWLGDNGFNNFVEDMGPKPGPEYTIDRIDSDGNYEPSNCRWLINIENTRRKGV